MKPHLTYTRDDSPPGPKAIDLTGMTFDCWTVLGYSHKHKYGHSTVLHWFVECKCGTRKVLSVTALKWGNSTSCGCMRPQLISASRTTHGDTGSPEYLTWKSMLERCSSDNFVGRKYYIDKGIKVCDRWITSYANFLFDMGRKPSVKHSIDRIDGSKDYSPDNCRWADSKTQCRNRSSSRMITYQGRTLCVTEWAEVFKMSVHAIRGRVRAGWSLEDTFTAPVRVSL